MVIYLDVLVFINIFVTYFLLLSSGFLLHRKAKKWRTACGAIFGGLSALVIFLPPMPGVFLLLEKLLISVVLVLIVFGFENWKWFLKQTASFYLVSFVYAGAMSALWFFITPAGMSYRNGVAYFNISAAILVISTVVVHLVLCLAEHFLHRTPKEGQMLFVRLDYGGREAMVRAFVDTGNQLQDIMSGLPVVVCELKALKGCLPDEVYFALQQHKVEEIQGEQWKAKVRVLPMNAVTGTGTLVGLKPDHIWIEQEHASKEVQAIVGFTDQPLSDGDFSMLVGTSLLENT